MNTTTLSALAEPTRLRIVELLRERPRPVGEIADTLHIRQPQASKHLRVLSEAGLVKAQPVAQQRIYVLQAEPFEELGSWLDSFKYVWATQNRLEALDEYLQALKAKDEPEE